MDAVRVALGNTGSKTTIHRYLKELEEEEGQGVGAKVAISEALQDLVARLAGRLHEEAEAVVAEAEQRFTVQLQERSDALEQVRQEAITLSNHLQRAEAALHEERTAHSSAQQSLTARATEIAQLSERVAGLTARVAEHEAHAKSLEEKHAHAREALEHYRTSVKEQREQEQRRHEHQVQELQVALRQANEALTAKNHKLLRLNRDNSQWLERHGRLERELADARRSIEAQQKELDALRLTAAEHQALQGRWAVDAQALEKVRAELTSAHAETLKERERRERAEAEALYTRVRSATLEELLAKLHPRAAATGPGADLSSRD